MKDNQPLEYHEKQQFNSENLQQYDNEGQRYFLAYLLRNMEEIEEFIKKIKGNGIIRKLDELGRIVIPMEYRVNKIIDGKTTIKIYSINNYVIVEILNNEIKENIKKFDNLGRIVIQKEIRKKLGWIKDDEIIVWDCGNAFILQKLRKECVFCKRNNNLMEFKTELICEECKNELKEI